jgi:hypothetical protein
MCGADLKKGSKKITSSVVSVENVSIGIGMVFVMKRLAREIQ